jgi:plasmid stabilization system protein ParE
MPKEQIQALPERWLAELFEVMSMLMLTPYVGEPYSKDNPDGGMLQVIFGSGKCWVIYLVLEDIRRVDILRVVRLPV